MCGGSPRLRPARPPAAAIQPACRPITSSTNTLVEVRAIEATSSAPSPLYLVYQERWHFSALTLTLVFATYALGLLVALLTVGGLSDFVWSFRPATTPEPESYAQVPTTSDESVAGSVSEASSGVAFVASVAPFASSPLVASSDFLSALSAVDLVLSALWDFSPASVCCQAVRPSASAAPALSPAAAGRTEAAGSDAGRAGPRGPGAARQGSDGAA